MQILKSVIGLAVLTFLSGCGSSGIVQSLSVNSTVDSNSDTIVSLETYLNLGSLQFPALTLPVMNPKNASEQIGSVALSRSTSGSNIITLEANASKILEGDITTTAKLPNGNTIPLSTTGGIATISLSSSSKLYLGGGTSPFIGFAIVISEFDALGSYVSGYSLFLNLAESLGLSGVAGVFSGGTGQNGIGLFVQIPTSTSTSTTTTLAASSSSSSSSASAKSLASNSSVASSKASLSSILATSNASASSSSDEDVLTFIATDESTSKSKKLKSVLGSMSQKKTKLRVK